MRTLRLVSIALALSTSLAACGGDTDVPAAPRAETHVAGSDGAGHAMLHEQPAPSALTATTPVAVTPRDVARVAPPATRGELTVRRALLATSVVDHEPVEASDTFDADGERLYLFLDVRNDAETDAQLTVSFVRTDLPDARERGGVALTVPKQSRRFRTWAWTQQVHTAGEWTAIVRNASGDEVTRVPFTVTAS